MSPFVIISAIVIINVAGFFYARDQARTSTATRTLIIRRSLIGIVVGLIVAFGSWKVLPTNPESPAMLITYLVSWLGGAAALLAGLVLIAAWTAQPIDRGVE